MPKDNVYVVVFHKRVLRTRTRDQWDVSETVEFVNRLRNRHLTESAIIGDYLNSKIISGKRNMDDYQVFISYLRKNYPAQMAELDGKYSHLVVPLPDAPPPTAVEDQFGNMRVRTVFD